MSLINEYRQTEKFIADLQAKLKSLEGDSSLQTELEFEGKLRNLMAEYSKSLRDIVAILDPAALAKGGVSKVQAVPGTRRARKVKSYKNPHNGEVIETKGGNHKTLKEWKSKWGGEEVESWATIQE